MLKKIRVDEPGASEYLSGVTVDVLDFNEVNEALEEKGLEKAEGTQIMLGITKAALATNSFLSAASFQETTKVLTEAAINGKVDPLIGLKENVLIGKLIPAGTGMKRYRSVMLDSDAEMVEEAVAEEVILDETAAVDEEIVEEVMETVENTEE
jgi:DNA-directed RNA polymerase subunit beta'